jgi:hypothetical protein
MDSDIELLLCICLPEVIIINDKEEFTQMSGWGYKKGFSETNLKVET